MKLFSYTNLNWKTTRYTVNGVEVDSYTHLMAGRIKNRIHASRQRNTERRQVRERLMRNVRRVAVMAENLRINARGNLHNSIKKAIGLSLSVEIAKAQRRDRLGVIRNPII